MDKKFTDDIERWVNSAADQRDNEAGALMLLKLTNNRIEYANIMRNPNAYSDYLERQLRKHLGWRLAKSQGADMKAMTAQAEAAVAKHLTNPAANTEQKVGHREDHDRLPEEIKSLYDENRAILRRMRAIHARLSSMVLDDSPCPDGDRWPFVKEIIDLDKKMCANWETYDHYPYQDE